MGGAEGGRGFLQEAAPRVMADRVLTRLAGVVGVVFAELVAGRVTLGDLRAREVGPRRVRLGLGEDVTLALLCTAR